jgi:hypothetical protein
MKAIVSFLIMFVSLNALAQTKKLEVTNTKTGRSVIFEESQRVKIITEERKKLVGAITFPDTESIAIDGVPVKIDHIQSIKNFPKKGRTIKNIVLGTGLGLLASSAVAAADGNGSAFALFAAGAGTTIVGGFIGNGNKNYIKRRSSFKILEQ